MWLPSVGLSLLGKTLGTSGKGLLAVSQEERRVPKFSQTSASSTEEGKVCGEGAAVFPPRQSASEGWPHPHRLKATFALQRKEMDLMVVLKSGG